MASTPDRGKRKKRQSLTPKHGQLTGFPRRIKDGVADLHNGIQKWEIVKNKGFNIITDIANLKIEARGTDHNLCYPDGLENMCHHLKIACDSLQQLSEKMSTISQQFEKIASLNSVSPTEVFFLSWPLSEFFRAASELSDMYEKELKSKRAIVESVAHLDLLPDGDVRAPDSSRDFLMTYVACWLHEPYIDEEARSLLLEELLLETGHHQ